jgi:hypothetical protein
MQDFTREDFLTFAEMHDIPVFYLCYAEFDSAFYEHAIVQFTDANEALLTLEHIHNLNVVCGCMMGAENTNNVVENRPIR